MKTLTRPARSGRGFAVALLELAVATSAALLLLVAVPGLTRPADDGATPIGSPAAGASSSAGAHGSITPIMVAMGPDADCGACHVSPDGGVGIIAIPALAHPLEGWGDCTACHADDRLVKTAPGHSSLHRADCLVCHKAPVLTGSPPPRPHHLLTGAPCLSCHDSKTAPLPTDMAGRTNCWICHYGTEFDPLFASPAPSGAAPPP